MSRYAMGGLRFEMDLPVAGFAARQTNASRHEARAHRRAHLSNGALITRWFARRGPIHAEVLVLGAAQCHCLPREAPLRWSPLPVRPGECFLTPRRRFARKGLAHARSSARCSRTPAPTRPWSRR